MKQSDSKTYENSHTNNYTYQQLEKEVNDRHKKLTTQSWRGDLSKNGLKVVSWGDLNELTSKVK